MLGIVEEVTRLRNKVPKLREAAANYETRVTIMKGLPAQAAIVKKLFPNDYLACRKKSSKNTVGC